VILVGLLAGPAVGVVVGLAAPLLAHLLTGLPLTVVLPLMTIEVAGYGLVAGLLWRVPIAAVWKVLAAQVAGRVATLAVIGVAGLFTQAAWASSPGAWWAALWTGLVGIAVQLAIIPVVMSLVGRRS
jgi:niacin transporter